MKSKVYVIDQDPHYRDRVSAIARTLELQAETHESGESFLTAFSPDEGGCIVSEMRLCGISGLELLDHLISLRSCMPVIFLTGHARTQTTVAAMKRGAMTVLDKPLDEDEVWNAIRRGLIQSENAKQRWTKHAEIDRKFSSLTDNEAKVAELIVQGKTNRQIAEDHRVSIRTIEARRQKTYNKLGVSTLPELVEITIAHRSYKRDDRHNPAAAPVSTRMSPVSMQVHPIGID